MSVDGNRKWKFKFARARAAGLPVNRSMSSNVGLRVVVRCVAVALLSVALPKAYGDRVPGGVVFSSVLHRHGDRSPTIFWPTDTTAAGMWQEGVGQLTPRGMAQVCRTMRCFGRLAIIRMQATTLGGCVHDRCARADLVAARFD